MSNKETLQNYNTKLNKNNTSLDSILESINKLSTVSGTLEITENGEHDVKKYDKAVVNVSQGSIKNHNEFKNAIYNQIYNFNAYLMNELSDTYEKYTTEPVTLYAPAETHKHYAIRCRSATSYQIIWFPLTYLKYFNTTNITLGCLTVASLVFYANNTVYEQSGWGSASASVKGYTSSNYSSIDACIEAMKSPDTTYTLSSSASSWSISDYRNQGGNYIIPCTNMPFFNDVTLEPMQRISSDETILVIGE